MANMALAISRLGPTKGLSLYADWTDRIAKGELPSAKPERPKGIERNVVISMWDWSTPKIYLHDAISSDKRNPRLNANGLIYGSPEEAADFVPVLDPVKNTATLITHPYLDPKTPSTKENTMGPSVYWGDDPIWDSHTSIHNPMMDEKGRVGVMAKERHQGKPAVCKQGCEHPSGKEGPNPGLRRPHSKYG